jgi:hypothetical protein
MLGNASWYTHNLVTNACISLISACIIVTIVMACYKKYYDTKGLTIFTKLKIHIVIYEYSFIENLKFNSIKNNGKNMPFMMKNNIWHKSICK